MCMSSLFIQEIFFKNIFIQTYIPSFVSIVSVRDFQIFTYPKDNDNFNQVRYLMVECFLKR